MTKSMTGFGRAIGNFKNKNFTVEIRSLNSKQFDLNIKMPSLYKEKELILRNEILARLERGKIDFSINYESSEIEKPIAINKPLALAYYNALKDLTKDMADNNSIDYLSHILKMPDVIKTERQEMEEEEWKILMLIIKDTINSLDNFRKSEGEGLALDLINRINLIEKYKNEIDEMSGSRSEKIKERLYKNLNEFIDLDKIDKNRFEQEVIFYLEKLDITEERVRLQSHCNYFRDTLNEKSSGKKLGFICQEIGREINTIGSKVNDADIQKIVVQMKDELEKVKEQLLNIL
jgi:uncharacterized protein (TIGR00255 family)